MKIGFLLPTLFASQSFFPDRIFAPVSLAHDTINGLVAKGHDVYVFSTPDFVTDGKLIGGDVEAYRKKLEYHKLQRVGERERDIRNDEVWKRSFELSTTSQAYAVAQKEKLDVIHSYHDFLFTPHYFEELTGISTVYTLHDPLPSEGSFEYHEMHKFAHHRYVSISNSQRQSQLKLNFVDTVYHGVRLSEFPYSEKQLGYLLFMGRLTREKGLHTAIQVALKTKHPLEIGTNFPLEFTGDSYFEEEIKPYLDDPLIHEPGMAHGDKKMLLYKDARALIFPIEWEEPFGMVMIEAMACGTPVIAYGRGSVPEIVSDGKTGFVVSPERGVDGLVEAVDRIYTMSEQEYQLLRYNCRKHVEEKFTVERMVEGYEKVYKYVVSGKL